MGEAQPATESQPPASPEKKRPASAPVAPQDVPAAPGMEFILDIPLEITVELGRTHMVINDLLKLGQGAVIELAKMAGETLEIRANQKLIAKGEVVEVNEKYGVRLTEIVSHAERVEKLK
ncbi:MAG: flagellar motor switch protein FliN [Desulfobacterales bacterium]